ncbi:MAG TPA: hypothetical protein VFQ66_01180 [Candidatus Limnocylindria bacterium]|nr:hypothetical protein [Candidatus Limnocylindria bacterium]
MRGFIAALILALASTLVGATPALADVPVHLHCLTTPGGTHAIAGGLTANAPHDAFTGFHFKVHLGALTNPNNPVTVAATSPTGSC